MRSTWSRRSSASTGTTCLPSTLPAAPLGRGMTREQRLRRRVGMVLAARGLVEVLTYPFVGPAELDALRLPADDARRRTPRLANPLSEEQPFLRGSLLPGLLAVARRNAGRGATDLAIFEMGSGLPRRGRCGGAGPATRASTPERRRVERAQRPPAAPADACRCRAHRKPRAAGLVGRRHARRPGRMPSRSPGSSPRHADVELEVSSGLDPVFHPGRCARLSVDGSVIGFAGELHPRVIEAGGAARPVRGDVARPRRPHRGGPERAPCPRRRHPAAGEGGPRRGGGPRGPRGRRPGRPRGGRRRPAGVGAAVRCLRGPAGARRARSRSPSPCASVPPTGPWTPRRPPGHARPPSRRPPSGAERPSAPDADPARRAPARVRDRRAWDGVYEYAYTPAMIRASVAGASGYAGGELLRLIAAHPDMELAALAAGGRAGEPLAAVHPQPRRTGGADARRDGSGHTVGRRHRLPRPAARGVRRPGRRAARGPGRGRPRGRLPAPRPRRLERTTTAGRTPARGPTGCPSCRGSERRSASPVGSRTPAATRQRSRWPLPPCSQPASPRRTTSWWWRRPARPGPAASRRMRCWPRR